MRSRVVSVHESYDLTVSPDPLPDVELTRRARDGDLDAFAEIMRRYEHRLRAVLVRILDDGRDVDEVLQDAFVQAWRNLGNYRGDAALFTWLYRIGVNSALARTRRKRPITVEVSIEDASRGSPLGTLPEAAAEARELRLRIVAALAQLPFEYREAVVLRDVAGLSNLEVAEALGISLAAAKSRVHRGRLQLRELLEDAAGR